MKFVDREFVVKGIFLCTFLFPCLFCTKKSESTEEVPDYYPRVNPNPNNIEELNVQDIDQYFDLFTRFYEIEYMNHVHENESRITFSNNMKRVIIMNKFALTAKFGINEFSHLTLQEFTDKYTGFNDSGIDNAEVKEFAYNSAAGAPPALDWRIMGIDPIVRHQGPCRSSYVFSAIANIENQISKHFNIMPTLSEQQAYDCEATGNCKYGGMPHKVFESIMAVGGIQEQDTYMYNPEDKRECKVNESLMVVKVTNIVRLKPKFEESLVTLLALYGPLVTTMYVSESVKHYMKGVLKPTDCDETPNHAVLLVGYGKSEDDIPYWIIKNSWGKLWGESGYMRLIRGVWACHIGEYVTTSVVEPILNDKTTEKTTTTTTTTSTTTTTTGSSTNKLTAITNNESIVKTKPTETPVTVKQVLKEDLRSPLPTTRSDKDSTSDSDEIPNTTHKSSPGDGIRSTILGDLSPEKKSGKLRKDNLDEVSSNDDKKSSEKSSTDERKSSEEKRTSKRKEKSGKKKYNLRMERSSDEPNQSSDEPKAPMTGVIEDDFDRHLRAESADSKEETETFRIEVPDLKLGQDDKTEYRIVMTDKKVLKKKKSAHVGRAALSTSESKSSSLSSEEKKTSVRMTLGYLDMV